MKPLAPVAIALAFLCGGAVLGQPTKKAPTPKVKAEQVPGYKPMVIEGFTVILSAETNKHRNDPEFIRKPLEVLEYELRAISAAMPAKSVDKLRNVLIFVEWDEKKRMSNGRSGTALAVYYGGHQLSLLARGMLPLKAKNVTVLSMKHLTKMHQPEDDAGVCVLLHEIAHAVHDQILGFENPAIRGAFKQALERKLVDAEAYAATNDAEFFAEMSCAYFDQLDYYPKTRTDLKTHDPETFKVMETVWGKAKLPKLEAAAKTSVAAIPPLPKLDLGRIEVLGKIPQATALKGKTTVVLYWYGDDVTSLTALTKAQAWEDELGVFGLNIVAPHQAPLKLPIPLKDLIKDRNIRYPVTDGPWVENSDVGDYKKFPICYVYAPDGTPLFRGGPFEAEGAMRSAIGASLIAKTAIADDPPAVLIPIVESIKNGKPPTTAFAKLTPLLKSKDEEVSLLSKSLLDVLTEAGQKALVEIEPTMKDDPLEAFLRFERLATGYKDTPVGAKANTHIAKLKTYKVVAIELKARPSLATVKKIESELASKKGALDPRHPYFRQDNALLLRQLEAAIAQMKRQYPDTRATEQAVAAGERYAVFVP
jgi:hypothetical protein